MATRVALYIPEYREGDWRTDETRRSGIHVSVVRSGCAMISINVISGDHVELEKPSNAIS